MQDQSTQTLSSKFDGMTLPVLPDDCTTDQFANFEAAMRPFMSKLETFRIRCDGDSGKAMERLDGRFFVIFDGYANNRFDIRASMFMSADQAHAHKV